MDGNYISTDIRYRDRLKSRRRSTSYAKVKSPGGGGARSRSVDLGVGGGARDSLLEEVGVGEGEGAGGGSGNVVIDEVFEEPNNVGGGENTVEEVTGGDGSVEVPLDGNVGAGAKNSNVTSAEESVVVPGGDGLGAGVERVVGDIGAMGSVEVPIIGEIGGGAEALIEEVVKVDGNGEDVLDDSNTVGDVYGMGGLEANDGVGGGAESGAGGAGGSGDMDGSGVEPIHHVPRWRLREILAHAEGECILLV